MVFPPIDNVTNLLQKFLDVQTRRAEVISGNIANSDTPGYVAKTLDFERYLKDAANESFLPKQTSGSSVSEPRVVDQTGGAIGFDGNTVDAGKEMADLAQAGTNFNFGSKILQSRFRLLRAAIREGR